MKIKSKTGIQELESQGVIQFCDAKGKTLAGFAELEKELKPFVESGEFGTTLGKTLYLPVGASYPFDRVLFVNMGKEEVTADDFRKMAGKAWKAIRSMNIKKVAISFDGLSKEVCRALQDGLLLSSYQYTALKSKKETLPVELERLEVVIGDSGITQETMDQWKAIVNGTNFARDLSQMPGNLLYPKSLAKIAKKRLADDCDVTVIEKKELKALKMEALLAVAQGSEKSPCLILMDYKPKNAKKTIALVGKAVTFDSGGISLKPSSGMSAMKGDMGGGATVFGIMSVLKAINYPHRVVGLVPAVENMPSGSATRPGDVVTAMNGTTVEINNTDAEGRLILADSLTYAARYKPDQVIDFATLTGACLVALGPKVCGVMGNDQSLVDKILKAGEKVGEPFWQLPLFKEYKDMLKSDAADLSNNASSREGGAITAGLFLEHFAKDYRWAHCDMAASIFDKADDLNPAQGTGAGVRMAIEALKKL